jgi:hypothetical protein
MLFSIFFKLIIIYQVRLPLGASPQALKDGLALLRLCFELGWPVPSLVQALLSDDKPTESSSTTGFAFFKHFSEEIVTRLLREPGKVCFVFHLIEFHAILVYARFVVFNVYVLLLFQVIYTIGYHVMSLEVALNHSSLSRVFYILVSHTM